MTDRELTTEGKGRVSIDWNEVQRRLEAARAALERAPGHEEKKRILKERAKALARESVNDTIAGESVEIVEFLLANERYGIESSYVREVFPLHDLTPLPCVPPFVVGILNVRGKVLSVIDIKRFFDLPVQGLTDLNKVIILESNELEFGILADSIIGVRTIPKAGIQTALPTLSGIREEFLVGVTKERVVILDAHRLVSTSKIIVEDEADTS